MRTNKLNVHAKTYIHRWNEKKALWNYVQYLIYFVRHRNEKLYTLLKGI
jgi:hypothetical protein